MSPRIRVIQYGVGPIGALITRLMLEKPALQVIGAVDIDPVKADKDLGEEHQGHACQAGAVIS